MDLLERLAQKLQCLAILYHNTVNENIKLASKQEMANMHITDPGQEHARYQVICCVLADIYFMTNNKKIKNKCRLATAMAKKIVHKLEWYKRNKEKL